MNTVGIALVWCTVQVTLVGLAAGGLYLILRRLRPAVGTSVTSTGLLIIAALSAMALSPWPRWSFVGPESEAGLAMSDHAPVPSMPGKDVPHTRLDESSSIASATAGQVAAENGPSPATLFSQALLDELTGATSRSASTTWRWPATLAVLFLLGVGAGAVWLVGGLLAVRTYRARSRLIEDRRLLASADLLRAELGCRRQIELRQSYALVAAATIGWRRPVLLLPAEWTGWTEEQRRAVLAHEIAHVRAGDFLAVLCGYLGLVLHFYHPLVHWLMNRLRLEQELAADAAAAGVLGGQRKYLTAIAELALRQPARPLAWPARSFLPTRATFLRRIAMLRDSKLRDNQISRPSRALVFGTVLICGLLAAGLRGPACDGRARAEPAEQAAERCVSGQAGTSPVGAESTSLKGTWSVVRMTGASPELQLWEKSLRFVFSGDTLSMRGPVRVIAETKYRTNAKKRPPTINLIYEGKPALGIYRIEGDDLTICLNRSASDRPTSIASQPDSADQVLFVLKRGDLEPAGNHLYVVNVDGSGLRKVAPLPEDSQGLCTGSPDWSPEGSKIAFDGWRLDRGQSWGDAHVYVVGVDGAELEDLGDGAMPSWSPDGKRLTCCRYSPTRGIWVMDGDGSHQKLVDQNGWGPEWSPTGNEIAYRVGGNGADICIADPDSGDRRTLLGSRRYKTIYFNPAWSPDGKQICFMGRQQDGTQEIAVTSAQGTDKGFRVLLTFWGDSPYEDPVLCLSWEGSADRIVTSMRGPEDLYLQLYVLCGNRPPERLWAFDSGYDHLAMDWAPDGKRVVVVRRPGQ
ncbi:M56 family metallopeptidase [Planctomycetota bacterium]